ncbi:MAG: DUF1015 domain-containing protein [Armatimonadetes bacterium]|nr:DUF1015 domain-containing protein [Armatimonadota bacterium]
MPIIEPFRALRYDATHVADLSAVTAPPYDVIDSELQARLLEEPYNIVHLDLNPATTDLNGPDNRYRCAAHLLGMWRDRDILHRDVSPAVYAYEQQYSWGGQLYRRRTVIARGRLAPWGERAFLPHERTFSAPKEDRFRLMVETRCQLSQALGIYPDPTGAVLAPLNETFARAPDMEAAGVDGSRNRVWIEAAPDVIEAVCRPLADRPVYIADGHHRYETALRYRDWLAAQDPLDPDHPAHYVSIALVGSADPGLKVHPTHRILQGAGRLDLAALHERTADRFNWFEPASNHLDGDGLDALLEEAPLDTVAVLTAEGVGLLAPRGAEVMSASMPEASQVLRELNVSVLHEVLLPTDVEPLSGVGELAYVHTAAEAVAAVQAGAPAAFLLRATPLEVMLEVAGGGELMPHKSTYFYPKLLTGLVLYPLRG